MTDKPICGGNCNACHTCPDLISPPLDPQQEMIAAYKRGYEWGKVIGEANALHKQARDRCAITAHWSTQGAEQAPLGYLEVPFSQDEQDALSAMWLAAHWKDQG